jgi:hypothetical protein
MLGIPTTPPHGHAVLVSALKAVLVVTLPSEAETFNAVLDVMTY